MLHQVCGLVGAGRPNPGHMLSGVPIRAAGVVPYVNLPGRGVHFLLQDVQNGTRAGKLCDFGGRREAGDRDAFATAARELCEETGYLFGVRFHTEMNADPMK